MNAPVPPLPMQPAGLWRRAAARAVDALCMLILYALTLAAVSFVLTLGVLASVAGGGDPLGGADGGGFLVLLLLLWVPLAWMAARRYEALPTARCGQTFGKRLMGICVVRRLGPGGIAAKFPERGSSNLRWAIPHAAVSAAVVMLAVSFYIADEAGLTDREGLLLLLGLWAFASAAWAACYMSALFSKQRRGWHDKAAGTMVVRATEEVLELLAAPEPPAREPRPEDRSVARSDPPQRSSYVQFWDQVWDDDAARRNVPPPGPEADEQPDQPTQDWPERLPPPPR